MKYIRRWLTEFRSLPETASVKYFENMKFSNELIDELHNMFNTTDSENANQLLDPVCHLLFNYYKSNVSSLRNFALEFIPAVVWSYFNLLKGSKQQSGGITAFLLGVYNLGPNEGSKYCLPSVFQSSVYHEPSLFSSTPLTESALKNRHNFVNGSSPNSSEAPAKKFDTITSQNRSTILSSAVRVYLSNISLMSLRSRKNLCTLCSRLSRMGFDDANVVSPIVATTPKKFSTIHETRSGVRRNSFEARLVVELLYGMQFLMYNGLSRHALRAIEDAHFRASYDLEPEVLMVANSLLNYVAKDETTKDDHSILPVTPAHSFKNHPGISKDAITNASFRPKKLPEDIEVQDKSEQPAPSDVQSSDEPRSDATLENEKSPQQAKLGKLQQQQQQQQTTKSSQKKEKPPKTQKARESESSKRLSFGIGGFGDTEGVQLKAVRRNSQDLLNFSDVGSKSRPSSRSMTTTQAERKNGHVVVGGDGSNNEADDATTATNPLSQSTCL